MNLLGLINSWLDIICQVTTKYATVPKTQIFSPTKHTLRWNWEETGSRCQYAWESKVISACNLIRQGLPWHDTSQVVCLMCLSLPNRSRFLFFFPFPSLMKSENVVLYLSLKKEKEKEKWDCSMVAMVAVLNKAPALQNNYFRLLRPIDTDMEVNKSYFSLILLV